ncbi:tigger transposable element-derived protein 4-like [Microplitis mediator]|uniref:tigger transposable element-derived protein 4-like n=1 Tax=Microplitis mediator TaxID=375433 RepID=UPI00255754F8|nr:tigger transposable element-derived protein 4-like [Microplitis mediator]
MPKRKINVLSLSDKLKIINAFESGKSRCEIRSEFGLPESSYYKIIKFKDSIKSQCSEGHGNIKRIRLSEFPDVEKCLLEWIKQTLDKNIPIDGPLLKQKSQDFALKLGVENFSASNGWLEGFKKRNDISFKKVAGESKSVDLGVCSQWTKDLPNLLEGYDAEDIYNADETALFYKCLPDKTFIFKGEKCHGGKQSKDRLTVLQCVNMIGTDKLPLLIIGKSKRPRCFKGVKTLPVDYANNTKAWMTKELFKDWLRKVNKQMIIKQKKILLIIDNCTAHTDLLKLENVKILFLPANTTSKLQSLDQGIIHTFKRFYRREVINHTLKCLDESVSSEINVLLAMKFARKAWYAVSGVTVQNCFKKAGFHINKQYILPDESEVELEVGPSDDEWAKLVSHETTDFEVMPTFDDFIRIDDDVATAGEFTEDDIIQNCVTDGNESDDDADQSQSLDKELEKIPKKQEALKALETLHKFFEYSAIGDRTIFDKIYELEKHAHNVKSGIQKKLTDFFK